MKKFFLFFLSLSFLSLVGWQIYNKIILDNQTVKRGGRGNSAAVAVETMPVKIASIHDIHNYTGNLEPRSKVIIAPKVAGRLERLPLNIGDRVKQGDLVALLDDKEFIQQMDQARAELEVARANLEESRGTLEIGQRDLDRTRELREKKIASESELDAAKSRYASQEAKVKVAMAQFFQKEAALKAAEVRLSYTKIKVSKNNDTKALFIGERFVDEGAMLATNTPIVSILDITEVIAVIHVIERDYSGMKIGLKALVRTDAFPEKIFEGKIVRIAPLLKESSREARVEIEISNTETLLKPGMFVRVEIEFGQRDNAMVVPIDSLVKRDGKQGVFLVDKEEKKARFVPVVTGIATSTEIEILTPKISGYVVTLGHHLLTDGSDIILTSEKGEELPTKETDSKKKRKKKSGSRGKP